MNSQKPRHLLSKFTAIYSAGREALLRGEFQLKTASSAHPAKEKGKRPTFGVS
jgi:hypothetical protein